MADLTVADIKERFAEFDYTRISDDVVTRLISDAYELTDVSESATAYCVAHFMALHPEMNGNADGGSGEVRAERIGPKQTSYMTQAETAREVFFSSTAYGRRVLVLESRSPRKVLSMVTG